MVFLSFKEVFDIILMTAAVAFIFMGFLARFRHGAIAYYRRFNWEDFGFAAAVIAPAIILHEFGHKFVAMGFGMQATFHAAYFWLALGIILRLARAPFIFFVPAYVSILGAASPFAFSAIAFAGPAVNLVLWLGAWAFLSADKVKRKYVPLVYLTKQVNMFLFIFNMLPIPGFDGFHVFRGLIQGIF